MNDESASGGSRASGTAPVFFDRPELDLILPSDLEFEE